MNELLQRLKLLNPSSNIRPCPVQTLLNKLDTETSELLNDLLSNPKVSARSIHRTLQESGYRLARESVSEHKNNLCRCNLPGATQ